MNTLIFHWSRFTTTNEIIWYTRTPFVVVMGKQKAHQIHARSAESWQVKTQHHLACKLGSFYYESHSSPIDIEIKLRL